MQLDSGCGRESPATCLTNLILERESLKAIFTWEKSYISQLNTLLKSNGTTRALSLPAADQPRFPGGRMPLYHALPHTPIQRTSLVPSRSVSFWKPLSHSGQEAHCLPALHFQSSHFSPMFHLPVFLAPNPASVAAMRMLIMFLTSWKQGPCSWMTLASLEKYDLLSSKNP